jgi:hypothetical protein
MAGWEEELDTLLRGLGVRQEEPKTHHQPRRKRMHSDVTRRKQAAGDLIWDDGPTDSDIQEDTDAWLSDLSVMRREVDAIVSQVIRLMQRGDLDKSSKEDVMVVLRALRRQATMTQTAITSDEAYLESAAAMLHFCRLVLRLSESAIEDY